MFRVPATVCASRPPTQNTPPVRINTVKMTPRIFATPLAAHYTSLRTELNRLECVVHEAYTAGASSRVNRRLHSFPQACLPLTLPRAAHWRNSKRPPPLMLIGH